jgi:tryptophan 2,3-dioxygenase
MHVTWRKLTHGRSVRGNVLHSILQVRELLSHATKMADESPMLRISQRLQRVTVTLKLCVAQWDLLFTMTPMDFEVRLFAISFAFSEAYSYDLGVWPSRHSSH